MRRRPVHSTRLVLAILACLAVPASSLAQLQWDPGITGTAAGGSGTWTASGITNWFNGATNVAWDSNNAVFAGAAGTVTIDTAAPPSATGLTFNTTGYTLDLGGGTVTVTGGSLGTFGPPPTVGTPTIGVGANLSATINAPIGGSGVVYVGAGNSNAFSGNLTLGGTNTFTAGVNITGGATLTVSSDANLGPNPAAANTVNVLMNGGTLHIPVGFALGSNRSIEMADGGVIVNGVQQIGGGGTIIVDSGTFSISTNFIPASTVCTISGAGNTTITGTVQCFTPNGHLIKTGSGTLSLTGGHNASSLTSDITVNGGILSIDQSNSLGNSVQPLTLNGGALNDTRAGSFQFINGGRAIIIGPNGGAINLTSASATTQTYTAGATGGLQGSGPFTLSGALANAAAVLVFANGTANTNTGSTTISNATLQTGGTNLLSPNSAVVLSNLGKLNVAGFSQTIASLADGAGAAGSVTLGNVGAATLTLGGDNSSTTFSGVISGNGTNGGIVKNGGGTFTLSGANTYGTGSGTVTTVNNGTLSVTTTTGSGTGSGAVNVTAGTAPGGTFGTLGGTGTIAGPVTVNAGTGGGPNGVIQPGTATTPIATLTLQNNLALPGTYNATIDPPTSNSSLLAVGGVLDLTGGASTLNVSSLPGASSGATYVLATFGSLNGTFTNTFLPSGYTVNYAPTAISISPVPEPAFILLACAGAAGGLGWYRRRR